MTGPPYPRALPAGSNAIGQFAIGVSPIGTMAAFDFWTTVISQYANSPRLTAMIQSFNDAAEMTPELDSFYDMVWNILTAQGEGLDVWGRILGVSRSVTLPATTPPAFGFQEPADPTHFVGFGQAPFTSGIALTTNFSFADADYRRILLAKAATNIWDGGMPSFNAILLGLFPGRGISYVADNQNMTATLTFGFALTTAESQLLGVPGFLPRPAAVAFSIATLPSWLPLAVGVPMLFADFSTEGTTNHYWYNGATYGSAAAWLAAIGGTFARSTTGFFTNASGNLASVGTNTLRFDYDPVTHVPKGILLEGGSTNIFTQSQAISSVNWSQDLAGDTFTSGQASPDGGTNASLWTGGAATGLRSIFQTPTIAANTTMAISIFAKAGTCSHLACLFESTVAGDYAAAVFNLTTGTLDETVTGTFGTVISTSIQGPWSGFYRITLVASVAATTFALKFMQAQGAGSNTYNSNGGITNAPGSNTVTVFGAQAEALPFASSYIPTTTAAVPRSADLFTFPWTFPQGTYFVDLIKLEGFSNTASLYFGVSTGDWLAAQGTGGTATVRTAGATSLQVSCNDTLVSENKFATSGSGSGRSICANAGTVASDANSLLTGTPTFLTLQDAAVAPASYGNWRSIGAWTVIATNAQLQALTA